MKSKLWAIVATLLLVFTGFLNTMLARRVRELEKALSWYLRQNVDRYSLTQMKLRKVLEEPYKALGKAPDDYPSWMHEDL